MKRTVALCLFFCFLVPVLLSCGAHVKSPRRTEGASSVGQTAVKTTGFQTTGTESENGVPAATTGATATDETDASAETKDDRWERVAAALSEGGAGRVLIELDGSEPRFGGARSRLFAAPDEIAETTPAAERLAYERNRAAREQLGISVEYVYRNDPCGEQAKRIETVVWGGGDAPDLFVASLSDLARATLGGCFADVTDPTGSYLNLGADGWFSDFIRSTSLLPDRAYILAGDAFSDLYRGATALPFNLSMLDGEAERLAPCILPAGSALSAGEKLSSRFYDFVAAGEWTYSALAALSAAVWYDVGTEDKRDDLGDVLGILYDAAENTASGAFLSCCGTDYLSESSDAATGRVVLTYLSDGGSLGALFDAVAALTDANGTLVTAGGFDESAGDAGLAAHRRRFFDDCALFAGAVPLGSLAATEYRTTEVRFSVAPLPKLRESDGYVTPVSRDADAGEICRFTPAFSAVTAYLQYCAENSKDAVGAYLASLTGTDKRPDAGLDRMLGIVCGAISSARAETVEEAVSDGDVPAWRVLMESSLFKMNGADFGERYPAVAEAKQKRLNDLTARWYDLPKGRGAD